MTDKPDIEDTLHRVVIAAACVLRVMPGDRPKPPGCAWPEALSEWHAYGSQDARLPRFEPTGAQIDLADRVVAAVAALDDAEDRKLIWRVANDAVKPDGRERGRGPRWRLLGKIYGLHAETVRRRYRRALGDLVRHLEVGR